jgi:protoporphyrin/coproporphyrin ferrochelatase
MRLESAEPAGNGTGIVMLNLGGPQTLDDVEPFLQRLFADRELLKLPWQSVLGNYIAKRRAPRVTKLYAAIGGGSPIRRWTETQGRGMCQRLDESSPETAPHKFYISFRYVAPFADDALQAMARDGITRAVAFTQYPQWSCTTTGSSLNELHRALARTGLQDRFDWSVIDRWHLNDGFIDSMAVVTRRALLAVPVDERDDALILFSAHSLPLSVIDRGDAYPAEVAASVAAVMKRLNIPNAHQLSFQSDVGPVRWLGPSTEIVLKQLGARRQRAVIVVPIAFTSDHIETLSELDIEYGHVARAAGITHYIRADALNAEPRFLDALSEIVSSHLAGAAPTTPNYGHRCPGCTNAYCRPAFRSHGVAEIAPAPECSEAHVESLV